MRVYLTFKCDMLVDNTPGDFSVSCDSAISLLDALMSAEYWFRHVYKVVPCLKSNPSVAWKIPVAWTGSNPMDDDTLDEFCVWLYEKSLTTSQSNSSHSFEVKK